MKWEGLHRFNLLKLTLINVRKVTDVGGAKEREI